MEELNKVYWRGIEELTNDVEFVKNAEKEFAHDLPENKSGDENNRRDFLKLMGFSVAAASLVACEAPIKKAIPFLNKPENLDPSIPNYYASTFFEAGDYASVVVKTREGRPIKIEGNTLSSISKGKTSAKAQASILSLYDGQRYQSFMQSKKAVKMADADKIIKQKLSTAQNVRILSSTIISPSTKAIIKEFKEKYESTKLVTYDSLSQYGLTQAHKESFGVEAVPSYDFSKAKVIVSFGCDFLGTWISPVEFSGQYAQMRKLNSKEHKEAKMSKHFQFEARMSMTGANADIRVPVKPSQEISLLAVLYDKIKGTDAKAKDAAAEVALQKAAKELLEAKGESLVVSGSNDENVQTVVAAINNELGNYGATIDITTPLNTFQGNDKAVNALIDDIKNGGVDAIIFYGVNPVYDHPRGEELKAALSKVGLKISFASQPDETTDLCDFVCPDNHYLESWGDAEPRKGHYSLTQPTITPIFSTRQAQESLLIWAGNNKSYYDYLRAFLNKDLFKKQNKYKSFDNFFTGILHDGVLVTTGATALVVDNKDTDTEPKKEEKDAKKDEKPAKKADKFEGSADSAVAELKKFTDGGLEITTYQKVSLGNGAYANNPWLQEMPDPITKACWGNYASMSPKTAKEKGVANGDVVKVTAGKTSFEVPVLLQPGQADNSIAVAVGYGRKISGKVGTNVGANVFPLTAKEYDSASISKTDKTEEVAQTQTHNTIMGRSIIQEASLSDYKEKSNAGRIYPHISSADGKHYTPYEVTLWKGHQYHNHSWGLVIDLNSCTGCSACTVACQIENNVPVVGKKEVLMRREMHWIRIDRYYSSEENAVSFGDLEKEAANPQVTFMPMMCQHCNNAPCETVCPVLATTHSSEGLNQMAYNRCIGTRYCANNCPYKVRRFNWFHYAEDDRFTDVNYVQTSDLGRMVINPDVTVRSRGVMEKCSLCVQRIQAGKLQAKKDKRQVKDGEIKTACQQVCPTDAITFGDMNDTESQISKALGISKEVKKGEHGHADETVYSMKEPRAYHVLEEINVKPQVSYLTKIRNNDKKAKAAKGHSDHKEHKEEKGGH
ncbi:MAG: 4Fe-4S dicluster domain-containing protein [Bacteroidetes bacterium]|nr:MAG: 4Fe-4S dicluster domain-containing protein [Bacteroidota bacterium]TAG89503.1 MAG: 4Fe-4S dicluster domain-containing protein [Bacteroidota bacterium]